MVDAVENIKSNDNITEIGPIVEDVVENISDIPSHEVVVPPATDTMKEKVDNDLNNAETDVDNDDEDEEDTERKVDVKFVFANRDGINVIATFSPSDTVGEVKAILMSLWPTDDLGKVPENGDQIRLICMGKGLLMPDSRTLTDCEVPIFKHPTPINVSVKPETTLSKEVSSIKPKATSTGGNDQPHQTTIENGRGGCCCIS